MTGTIFGLGMSQRVDSNGLPSVGWLLYVYAPNSSTPVNAYQDTGLTILHSWPIQADANGMMPAFWLPDGYYRVRGTSNDGSRAYFDQGYVLAIGASSGAVSGGSVDPTTIFQTGDVLWLPIQATRIGWVRDNGRTIGSATSGATERANADCQPLFEYLWIAYDNTRCNVAAGRGASALADWNANKTITTVDMRGFAIAGLDGMGNTAAGRWPATVPLLYGGPDFPSSIIGEVSHTTTAAEMPVHNHAAFVADPGHSHTFTYNSGLSFVTGGGGGNPVTGISTTGFPGTATTTIVGVGVPSGFAVSIGNNGAGATHNNVQQTVLGTFFRKL